MDGELCRISLNFSYRRCENLKLGYSCEISDERAPLLRAQLHTVRLVENGADKVKQIVGVATEQNLARVARENDFCGWHCRVTVSIEVFKRALYITIKSINRRMKVFAPILPLQKGESDPSNGDHIGAVRPNHSLQL